MQWLSAQKVLLEAGNLLKHHQLHSVGLEVIRGVRVMMATQPLSRLALCHSRVLVVEDELFVRMDIADALRRAGFIVVEAANADDAATFVDAGEPLDALFTDVQLPGALNGLSLARRVKAKHPNVPIIITSADGVFREEALRLGTFVPKPYEVLRVIALINDLLDPTQV